MIDALVRLKLISQFRKGLVRLGLITLRLNLITLRSTRQLGRLKAPSLHSAKIEYIHGKIKLMDRPECIVITYYARKERIRIANTGQTYVIKGMVDIHTEYYPHQKWVNDNDITWIHSREKIEVVDSIEVMKRLIRKLTGNEFNSQIVVGGETRNLVHMVDCEADGLSAGELKQMIQQANSAICKSSDRIGELIIKIGELTDKIAQLDFCKMERS